MKRAGKLCKQVIVTNRSSLYRKIVVSSARGVDVHEQKDQVLQRRLSSDDLHTEGGE